MTALPPKTVGPRSEAEPARCFVFIVLSDDHPWRHAADVRFAHPNIQIYDTHVVDLYHGSVGAEKSHHAGGRTVGPISSEAGDLGPAAMALLAVRFDFRIWQHETDLARCPT
jgi:hypothetical protein